MCDTFVYPLAFRHGASRCCASHGIVGHSVPGKEDLMVLSLQLLVVTVVGYFVFDFVRDFAETNIALAEINVAELQTEEKRYAMSGATSAMHAANFCVKCAKKKLRHIQRWGF